MEAVVEVPDVAPQLTAHDRCDRCGAQAYVTAAKDDLRILFCQHHGREHADRLVSTGWATWGLGAL